MFSFVVVDILCCLRTIYAKYLNSTSKSNNFYNSNQTYKYSITGKGWGYALIKPALKHFFFKIATLIILGCVFFLNRNMNTFYWNKWCKNRCPNVCVSAPDSNTFYVYLLFMVFFKIRKIFNFQNNIKDLLWF